MKHGDYTELAKHYVHRAGYSETVLELLARHAGAGSDGFMVADVGAGTGKLTEGLLALGLNGFAVEPNDAMRAEGIRAFGANKNIEWKSGRAEATGLPDNSVDWALMGSSFHWTDAPAALAEFHRILKPGGFFTALWNPRDIEANPLEQRIEQRISEMVPELNRVSSGGKKYTEGLDRTLTSTGHFTDVIFVEAMHEVVMSKERYMGLWASVNDLRVQAGEQRFQDILAMIEQEIAGMDTLAARYKTRAWTAHARVL